MKIIDLENSQSFANNKGLLNVQKQSFGDSNNQDDVTFVPKKPFKKPFPNKSKSQFLSDESIPNNPAFQNPDEVNIDNPKSSKSQQRPKSYENCRAYIVFLVNYKDYSINELITKSKIQGYNETDYNSIIDSLLAQGLINDARLAENIVHIYNGKKGKNWLYQKLLTRKIPKDIITQKLLELDSLPNLQTKQTIASKFQITDFVTIDIKTKNKIFLFLSSRGFANPQAILNSWANPDQ